jgi:hypothetical protein
MEFLGRDSNFGAETELFTVDEPGGCVDEDCSSVDLRRESVGRLK